MTTKITTDIKRLRSVDGLFIVAPTKAPRFVLCAEDGRMVTNDSRMGPSLTSSRALSYVWTNPTEADSQRLAYQAALGVVLKVRPQ